MNSCVDRKKVNRMYYPIVWRKIENRNSRDVICTSIIRNNEAGRPILIYTTLKILYIQRFFLVLVDTHERLGNMLAGNFRLVSDTSVCTKREANCHQQKLQK